MESALIDGDILVGLLGVNLVDGLGSDGSGVQVNVAERSRGTLLANRGLLGDLVVLDGGSAGGPGGAQNLVGLAVQVSELR